MRHQEIGTGVKVGHQIAGGLGDVLIGLIRQPIVRSSGGIAIHRCPTDQQIRLQPQGRHLLRRCREAGRKQSSALAHRAKPVVQRCERG